MDENKRVLKAVFEFSLIIGRLQLTPEQAVEALKITAKGVIVSKPLIDKALIKAEELTK